MQPPWTEDPIMSRYFFTNTYRELDKVSLWFIVKVLREEGSGLAIDLLFSTILLRRCFNRPETYDLILRACEDGGENRYMTLSPQEFLHNKSRILRALTKSKDSLYSHAYTLVVRSQRKNMAKSKAMVNLLYTIANKWDSYLTPVVKAKSPAECLKEVRRIPFLNGGFYSYEVFCDLNYCEYFLDRWGVDAEQYVVNVGPGAVKGLAYETGYIKDPDGTPNQVLLRNLWKNQLDDFSHLFIKTKKRLNKIILT